MTDEERTIFEKALQEAWEHYCNNGRLVDQFEDNYTECAFAKGFKAGYMQMLENPSGGALLHVLHKGAAIGERETINKVSKFILEDMFVEDVDDKPYVMSSTASSIEEFIGNFLSYMEEIK